MRNPLKRKHIQYENNECVFTSYPKASDAIAELYVSVKQLEERRFEVYDVEIRLDNKWWEPHLRFRYKND